MNWGKILVSGLTAFAASAGAASKMGTDMQTTIILGGIAALGAVINLHVTPPGKISIPDPSKELENPK